MSGRLQKTVATIVATGCIASAQAGELPGATLRDRASGWSASLFVAPPTEARTFADAAPPIPTPPVVNASAWKWLGKDLALRLDVTNVLDQAGPRENGFFQPPQPRGFVLQLRKTF